ncbi:hypothetical protein BSPWISOX_2748 [uncultured Gammaproteobacteria bacterium]|nr:hypothetical protein BSPWISOX_2748 [uncultured Gammaproteobacteria bacterium]
MLGYPSCPNLWHCLVSVAGCLGYDVLAYVARYVMKKVKFQLLVV